MKKEMKRMKTEKKFTKEVIVQKEEELKTKEEYLQKRKEELKKRVEEEKKRKEEKRKKKKRNNDKKKDETKILIDEDDLLKDENIELISFEENSMDLNKFREMELYEHNYLRNLHGVPPLKLNEELNEIAQNYAYKLAKEKRLEHSNRKDRELKDKKGQWVGENLYGIISTAHLDYVSGEMTKAWYDEIKNYNFKTGKSKDVTGHFTQVIWKNSKEVGFGIVFNGNCLVSVANYYPGGNYNFDRTFSEQLLDLIPGREKSSKDLFNLENVKKRELLVINEIRKKHKVPAIELDENLCNYAKNYIEEIFKTGSMSTSKMFDGIKHSVNYTIMNLVRGAVYKGGEAVKKWYKELLDGYDFEKNLEKNGKSSFDLIMGKNLIKREFKEIGFGYYFTEHINKLYVSAIFDTFY